jgi:hypothetical protein
MDNKQSRDFYAAFNLDFAIEEILRGDQSGRTVFDLYNTRNVGSNPARSVDAYARFLLCFCCPLQIEAMSLADLPPKQ